MANTCFFTLTLTFGTRSHRIMSGRTSTLYIMSPMHLQSLKLLCPMVKEEMHLQEKKIYDPKVKVTYNIAQYPQHHKTYIPAQFEVATSNILREDAKIYKKIHYLTLTLGSRSYEVLPSTLYIM